MWKSFYANSFLAKFTRQKKANYGRSQTPSLLGREGCMVIYRYLRANNLSNLWVHKTSSYFCNILILKDILQANTTLGDTLYKTLFCHLLYSPEGQWYCNLSYIYLTWMYGSQCGSLALHVVYKSRVFYCKSCNMSLYQYYKSHENPYQVLQVTCAASECAMKSKVCMIKLLSCYTGKISLVCCCWHSYSCCPLVTIQTATNLWYLLV